MFNNSKDTFYDAKKVPIIEKENNAIYNKNDEIHLDNNIAETTFIRVINKRKKDFVYDYGWSDIFVKVCPFYDHLGRNKRPGFDPFSHGIKKILPNEHKPCALKITT